jgi:protein-disulfide isomerase
MSVELPPADPLPPPMPDSAPLPPRAWLVIGPIIVDSSATLLIGAAMLVVGLVAGFLLRPVLPLAAPAAPAVASRAPADTSSGAVTPAEETQVAADSAALMAALVQQTKHFLGDPNAPVTLIEFSDFQCPYCGRFARDTFVKIDDAYIGGGQVRVGYQHFAFLGDESQWAGEAAECAGDQDAFWEYHDYLFAHQSGENQGAFALDNLQAFAVDLGLNPALFNQCLADGTYTALVAGQTQAAQQLGVRSTPTFVLNGRPVLGAQPFEVFDQYIQQALGN